MENNDEIFTEDERKLNKKVALVFSNPETIVVFQIRFKKILKE